MGNTFMVIAIIDRILKFDNLINKVIQKISLFYKIKMSSESSKNSKTIQSTLNFPLLYTIPKNKGKSKEINNLELKKQVTQQTLSKFFPSLIVWSVAEDFSVQVHEDRHVRLSGT